jgi:hypothetical protein
MKNYKVIVKQGQENYELVALGTVQAKSKKEAIQIANNNGFFGKLKAEQCLTN